MQLMKALAGSSSSWQVPIEDETGTAIAYLGTEVLAGSFWAGRDQPALFAFTPTWSVPASGLVAFTVPGSSTATLDPAVYTLLITIDGVAGFEAQFEVEHSPAAAAALTSYASFAEMLDVAPAIGKFQTAADVAGFARQRYKARKWFEDLLHRHYRGDCGWPTDTSFGWVGISFGTGTFVPYRTGRRSKQLQDWLDAGRLDVTEPVRDAVTYQAVALVYARQAIAVGGEKGADFAAMARKFFSRAEDAAELITAELDTDGDGTNDTVIRLGIADTLEG